MIKFIRPDIYATLCKLDTEQLMSAKTELERCLKQGIIKGGYGETTPKHSYQKELEFINYRLQAIPFKRTARQLNA